jgi:hypothetical protein
MGDLKPLGSEKLKGNEKLNRILELTYFNEKTTNKNNSVKADLVKESTNGVYGIIREKDGYYVKKGLNEQSLDYIGGLFMKNKNRFTSYAEALKRLELLSSQELQEETKYVLKTNKPTGESAAPSAPPMSELPPAPVPDAEPAPEEPAAEPSSDTTQISPEDELSPEAQDGADEKRSSYMAEVQKYSGKLGQELRDQQPKMESDDIKYVLNMIISAVDLDKLDLEDLEAIGKQFERDEEEGMGDEEMPTGEFPGEDTEEAPADGVPAEDDLAERMSKLEELINSKFGEAETDLSEFDMDMEPSAEEEDMEYDGLGDEEAEAFDSFTDDEEEDEDLYGDITPELSGDINESINTTLSKYFE